MRGGRIFGNRLEDKEGTLTLKITAALWWERLRYRLCFDGDNERHVNDCVYVNERHIESIYKKKKCNKVGGNT